MEFRPVVTGFCLLEAPIADDRGVWFSDMVLGGIRCLRPDGRLDAWLTDRRMIGGIVFNDDGCLLCSGRDGIIWLNPETGERGMLLDAIDGQPVRGINDMAADGRGGLYFGSVDHVAMFSGEPFFGRSALNRLDADRRVTLISDGHSFANGLGMSPDGRHLYFNDSGIGTYDYPIRADGSVGERNLLSKNADCDGLAVDSGGGIWIAQISAGSIARLLPDGTVDRTISFGKEHVTSLCFGGPDWRDLYVTTATPDAGTAVLGREPPATLPAVLYHARADIAGVRIHARIPVERALTVRGNLSLVDARFLPSE